MGIRKFRQFENKKAEFSSSSKDFIELEEIWNIICDLNIEFSTEISIGKYWHEKERDILDRTKTFNSVFTHCIPSAIDIHRLDKLYFISILVNKKLLLNIESYSNFSDDFFVACNRLQDIGDVRIDVGGDDRSGPIEYSILLKVKRK